MLDPVSVLASPASSAVVTVASAISKLRATPFIVIPTGPILIPIPLLPVWPFQLSTPIARELSVAERTAAVSSVKISPDTVVGYIGDSVTFVAMGTDIHGQPAHGAKFTWESSDPTKLAIDEAGRAAFLQPGLVTVTAGAGLALGAAPVLIRPTRRRMQTDEEWRADQDSLVADGRQSTDGGRQGVLASLMDRLAPTAHAQGGGQGADYGNATWPGQAGTPPFTALEDTRLGQ